MKTGMSWVLLVLMAGVAFAADAPQDYAGSPAKHWHEVDTDFMKAFHNPMEGLEMGLDLRMSQTFGRNLFSLNDDYGGSEKWNEYNWQRYRTRWSTKWSLSEDVDFNTRLTWEFWGHCSPDNSFDPFFTEDYEFDEAIFDHMNVVVRNAFDMPMTLTVGRQDIILGTGWLVLDGTPGDGSRTIFFDAVRATYDFSETSKVDLIYVQQYDNEDKWLKPFNHGSVEERRHLTQGQDERGLIAYFSNQLNDVHSNELYYIYKNEEQSDWNKQYASTPSVDADIHTVGTRFFGKLDENWSYTAEIAKQWGDRDGDSLQALGSNSMVTYAFNNDISSEIHFGYEYMSGDDPSTPNKDEQFDSLWGDWPQFQRGGDLQAYVWAFEGDGLGNVTNLHRFGVGQSFKPHKDWKLQTDYNLLWADENTYSDGATGAANALNYSESGNFRGHLLTGLLTYQCCKNFRTQFLLDYFIPGGYYDDPSTDDAYFGRVMMEWTF